MDLKEKLTDLKGNPLGLKYLVWERMEDLQEQEPYVHWGWYGFIPMIWFA